MTLIYEYNGKRCTLEQLIKKFPMLWEIHLRQEYKFWKHIYFEDLIIETSDSFEEELQMEDFDIEFIETNDEDFDLNIIFKPLLNFQIK